MKAKAQNRKARVKRRKISSVEFLKLLYSNYFRFGGKGLLEFRPIKGKGGILRSIFSSIENIKEILPRIHQLNRVGYNIYFSVNPRPLNKKKQQKYITDIICIWVDVDAKNFDGGKEEAFKHIRNFPLKPNIIVDSGNGYHAYWILEKPIIGRTEEQTLEVKQIMNGLITSIGADRQRKNIDSIMRLAGTLNTKNPDSPKECQVVSVNFTYYYTLEDFEQFKDVSFSHEEEDEDVDLSFEGIECVVSNKNQYDAQRDVQKLKVSPHIKRKIIVGSLQTENGKDKTRSGRDQGIITGLIAAGYNYKAIKSIFLNKYLKCSDRIDGDIKNLEWDVKSAFKFLARRRRILSPSEKVIYDIENSKMKPREKIRAMRSYIIKDLLSSEQSVGIGYKSSSRKIYYFFNKEQKILVDTESEDFKHFLVNRYGLLDKDLKEILRAFQASIYKDGEEIEPHIFAYFKKDTYTLYISNHDNQIYKLDGNRIALVDNGTDGVIFEYRPSYIPFRIDLEKIREMPNYFHSGFNWREFATSESSLFRHFVSRANFAREETYNLSVDEQMYILTIYFYSLFFESLLGEKPILCFVGVKSSGKSFIATLIGKILFGNCFFPNHLSDSLRDFKVMLSENSYVVFDNLDSSIHQFMDAFCAAATGAEISARKLFTDREEIKVRPRVFIVITSREPKFRRDDFVDRLILLNTELVRTPMSRSALFKEVDDNREMIMTEILVNMNSIIRLLRRTSDWNPACIFRIADWELFGKRIHSPRNRENFINILKKMNKEKSKFGLEEDPLYILLKHMVYDRREQIIDKSASELYEMLLNEAEDQRMKDFSKRYKSSISLGRRLANIKEELRDEFDFQIRTERMGRKVYSFKAKGGEGGEDNQ